MMRSEPICALVVGVVLILLVVLSRRLCCSGKATPTATKPPGGTREPKPFAGFTRKPDCPVCEQEAWWGEQLDDALEAIRLASVEALLRDIQDGHTPKTIANYAETIAAFCDWCVERRYLAYDPSKIQPSDTTPQSRRRAMTVEEIARRLRHVRRSAAYFWKRPS